MTITASRSPASVNGVPLHAPDDRPSPADLRRLACTELLRQEALRAGWLDHARPAQALPGDGGAVLDETAEAAIERLLDAAVQVPEADEAACRRFHAAHAAQFGPPARVRMRHVLLAVTPGVEVNALRARAEALLLQLRCAGQSCGAFADAARQWSNCPSGAQGGELGWLSPSDCAEEFAREVFGLSEVGVLPRLVTSRFGLHVVEVLEREAAVAPPFEQVAAAVAAELRRRAWAAAVRHYLLALATQADLQGVDLAERGNPLVQ